ncbi:MFS transporter [Paractinoplanes brasiliensis]|uniref:Putative MFS family arabinose efflux permease n=1 Tax=Paractinoplanes brasiliensis TaxID=52695 RepID=A0A4R6JSQ1_9ACTN|nr:MFS transporter [Actinoplanes brasiliensis]TDO39127.1 putative MFS family arabinose efflux permease [Actinoplanes brasiliensis]GID30172.1 MFS transporter [Actinoplanes brasiliensis]
MRSVLNTTFRSLRVRNYRLFAIGQLVKLVGVWMMFTAQDWLVLDLSGNSPSALGLVTSLQFLPVLLLTLYAGKLADRFDKRRLLIMANTAFAVTAVALAVIVASGHVQLWHVFLFAGLLGIANAVETPVRQAFVSELVELRLLPNALALSAATFNTARIGGPALAGVALALFGTGPVFLISTAVAIAPIFSYAAMRTSELRPAARQAKKDARILDGLRYVGRRSDLVLPIALMFVVGMIGFNFPVTLAALAKIDFNAGPSTFGLLTTALAVGALGGALAGSARRARPSAYIVIGAAIAFGALEFAVGFAPNFVVAMLVLVPTGFFSIYLAQAANHRVQMGVDPEYRGRVMAIYVLVFLGTTPIGASLAGWWGEHFGVASSISGAGIVCFVAAVVALFWQLRSNGERIEMTLRPRPRLTLVPPVDLDQPAPAKLPTAA